MDVHRLRRHSTLLSPFETLIVCPCGHVIGKHDADGCSGGRLRPCDCRESREAVLDAATQRAADEQLMYWSEPNSSRLA